MLSSDSAGMPEDCRKTRSASSPASPCGAKAGGGAVCQCRFAIASESCLIGSGAGGTRWIRLPADDEPEEEDGGFESASLAAPLLGTKVLSHRCSSACRDAWA